MEALAKIIDQLELDERLSGWQVRELHRRSEQLFLNKDREEGRRGVESLSWEVEILLTRRTAKPGSKERSLFTGNARFSVDPASLGRFKADLDAAAQAAALVCNEPYGMAEVAGQAPRLDLADPRLEADPQGQLEQAAEELRRGAAAERGVRLAAAEFFADRTRTRYLNSQGVHCLYEATLFSGEFCLLAAAPSGETEVFRSFRRRRLQDVGLPGLVAEAGERSRRRLQARLPQSGGFDVVFSGEALDHFFGWCLNQASGSAKYNRLSQAEIGDVLIPPAPGATPLTLHHNALIPWAVGSYKVDPSGTLACRRLLIEKGRLKARQSNARYAQYLKAAATGELGNVEVEAGREGAAELLKPGARPLYHLSDFSYFEPNPVTGEFSAEIRYGEELGSGGSQAVKGGSVSGLSREALASARFSAETELRERYAGPKFIRCENLTLAGD